MEEDLGSNFTGDIVFFGDTIRSTGAQLNKQRRQNGLNVGNWDIAIKVWGLLSWDVVGILYLRLYNVLTSVG
jgi:hypothetical protein